MEANAAKSLQPHHSCQALAEAYLFCEAEEGAGGETRVQIGIQVLPQQVAGLVCLVEELEWPDMGARKAPQPLPASSRSQSDCGDCV